MPRADAPSAMPDTMQTERLHLRLLGPIDLDVVHSLFSSSGHTIGDGPVADPASTLNWLERRQCLHTESGLAWYGLWDGHQDFVGTCGVFLGRCGEDPELGYEIFTSQRGHGYAAESAELVTHACHAAGHPRIWATIRPQNVASIRTVLTNGYVFARSQPDATGALDYYLHASEDAN